MAKIPSTPFRGRLTVLASGLSVFTAASAIAAPAASSPAETAVISSRYVGPETDAYILALSSRFASASRVTDPFGQIQDPGAKPAQPKVAKTLTNKATSGPAAKPFSEIVKLIRVTTVMPAEKRFLVGTRSISRGDTLPIVTQGRRYRVEVVDVTSERILFRDLDHDENGELRLDVMPQGMSRGIKGVLAPGMQATKADAPLEIDAPGNLR